MLDCVIEYVTGEFGIRVMDDNGGERIRLCKTSKKITVGSKFLKRKDIHKFA